MVTFNSKNSTYEGIETFFDVPKGSNLIVNAEGDTYRSIGTMLHERDTPEKVELAQLLSQLNIENDEQKVAAFLDLVQEIKSTQSPKGLLERIKESRFFGVLGIADPLLSVLGSAVTIASII